MTPLLEAEGLAIGISHVEPVSSVEFVLERGQCLGIVGETGSGKSLTCRAITGTLHLIGGAILRGEVILDGRRISGFRERDWAALRGRQVALVPQNSLSALNPVLSVGRQIMQTISALGGARRDRRRALDLLESVELGDAEWVLGAYPHQLSGGMRQRVMIALAIAGEPSLLVADEPTTALDVTVQASILRLMARLKVERSMSIVLVSHDLGVIESIADRIAVMYAGMTVESGRASDLLDHPAHPYTVALLRSDPARVPRGDSLVGIAGAPPDPRGGWPPGCRLEPRCPLARLACALEPPAVVDLGDGHRVRCIRPGDAK